MSTPNEIDHSGTDEIVCPHCGHEHGDSAEHFYDVHHDQAIEADCDKCEKPFVVDQDISVSYTTRKIRRDMSTENKCEHERSEETESLLAEVKKLQAQVAALKIEVLMRQQILDQISATSIRSTT